MAYPEKDGGGMKTLKQALEWLYQIYFGKHRRPYPVRIKEKCVCGRMVTRHLDGTLHRHKCVLMRENEHGELVPVGMAPADEIAAKMIERHAVKE